MDMVLFAFAPASKATLIAPVSAVTVTPPGAKYLPSKAAALSKITLPATKVAASGNEPRSARQAPKSVCRPAVALKASVA